MCISTSAAGASVIRTASSLLHVLAAIDTRTCAHLWLERLHTCNVQQQTRQNFSMSSAAAAVTKPHEGTVHPVGPSGLVPPPAAAAAAALPPPTPPAAAAAAAAGPLHANEVSHLSRAAPLQLPSGVKKTFYKRKLPCPPATEFSSAEGRQLFAEALAAGTMTGFFKLIEQYSTQDEPAFCGLSSLAMVLNALSIDPKRPWKGSWRWFHETLLDCCLPLDSVAQQGVVLTQAACLAKCNGARVSLHRAGTFTLEEFRQQVLDVATSGEEHLIVSYTRKAFLQTGDGHFSPVGGYHAHRDLVLILDTARFKYPPHWVPLPMLYEAMSALDPTTNLPRGFLRLATDTRPDSVLFTLDIRGEGWWRDAERFINQQAPLVLQSALRAGATSPQQLVCALVAAAPLGSVGGFIAVRLAAQQCARDRCVPHAVRHQVLVELRATPLYQLVTAAVPSDLPSSPSAPVDFLAEKLTMLLLLREAGGWGGAWPSEELGAAWHQLLESSMVSIVDSEVRYLREQLAHLDEVLAEGGSREARSPCASCEFKEGCTVHQCLSSTSLGTTGGSSSLSGHGSSRNQAGEAGGGSSNINQMLQEEGVPGSCHGCCS